MNEAKTDITARLEKLEQQARDKQAKVKTAKNQIKRLEQVEKDKERKRDTRRKILVGAVAMRLMKEDPALEERLRAELDRTLTRDIDRELLGLGNKGKAQDEDTVIES